MTRRATFSFKAILVESVRLVESIKNWDPKHVNEGIFLNELHDVESSSVSANNLCMLVCESVRTCVCDGVRASAFVSVWSLVHYTASFLESDPSFTPCILNSGPLK